MKKTKSKKKAVKLKVCELCEKEFETLETCQECGTEYCKECGDVGRGLCQDCVDYKESMKNTSTEDSE
ncbi:MAG: hypothetical protein GOU97_01770 [Nanoarchaeota archaeon]|nr:hypothetical protein [Nanoarchaeota archaeon]